MIVATRLSAVWQVAGVAAAALCCYLVSQSVATERAGLEKVDRQIAEAHDDIAKLQTEIGVRARMGQLESWNRDVLALQAPRPSQFVASGVQLAALYGHHGQPALQLDPAIASQQGSPMNAAYQPAAPADGKAQSVPAVPAPVTPQAAPAQPMLRTAAYVRPVSDRLGATSTPSGPTLQKASFELEKTAPPKVASVEALSKPATPKAAKPKPADKAEPRKEPVRVATRDPLPHSLLPADIGALAAREAKGAKDSSKAAR
jgi:hypothetical protein